MDLTETLAGTYGKEVFDYNFAGKEVEISTKDVS